MIEKLYNKVTDITTDVSQHHVGAYAAQSSYFFMLALIPILLLLLLMIRLTPVTKADVMAAVLTVFPTGVNSWVTSIVNQVYNQSMEVIPITVIVALWSAGKGILALTTGLNCVYKCKETRNYIFLRIRATLYTVLFLTVMIALLVMMVFANTLYVFAVDRFPMVEPAFRQFLKIKTIVTPIVIIVVVNMLYKALPNRKGKLLMQIPGSIFASIGWMVVSWVFSVYVDIFTGFSSMYGSLTTIILIMLWMYFCMYCILLGGEVNMRLHDRFYPNKEGV